MKEVLCLHVSSLYGENAKKFEEQMYMWAQYVGRLQYKAVKVFDRNRLLVGETTRANDAGNVYSVKISQLTIEYICISGDMCVFTKVSEVKDGVENVIYEIPDSWEGAHLWHSY